MRKKSFQCRLLPTKAQVRRLNQQLEECRWLYNHFLAARKELYEKEKKSTSLYGQHNSLAGLKAQRTTLKEIHSQVLQNVAVRIDLAFQAFFRRCKVGENPGYPRFKQYGRYDSITFPQAYNGCCELRDGCLRLSKVGAVPIILHCKLKGKGKSCTIKRSSTGKWFASFSCEIQSTKKLEISNEQIGIDVGLTTFATLSNGEEIKRERFFKTDEKELARAQRRLAAVAKGTPERTKRRKPVSKIHERIANRRKDFAHQHSRRIINRFGFIAVEDLTINQMVKDSKFSKSIMDTAWRMFFNFLSYKAEEAGRTFVKVNPAYTSQTCSRCDHRQLMPVTIRTYQCPDCGLKLDRDHNAALNILRLGLQSQGIQSQEALALTG